MVCYVLAAGDRGYGEWAWKKGGVKCKCSPKSKWRGFAHTWLKNITVRGILGKSWLADAVQAGLAKAGLQASCKNIT